MTKQDNVCSFALLKECWSITTIVTPHYSIVFELNENDQICDDDTSGSHQHPVVDLEQSPRCEGSGAIEAIQQHPALVPLFHAHDFEMGENKLVQLICCLLASLIQCLWREVIKMNLQNVCTTDIQISLTAIILSISKLRHELPNSSQLD